jgi:hypothetical protein
MRMVHLPVVDVGEVVWARDLAARVGWISALPILAYDTTQAVGVGAAPAVRAKGREARGVVCPARVRRVDPIGPAAAVDDHAARANWVARPHQLRRPSAAASPAAWLPGADLARPASHDALEAEHAPCCPPGQAQQWKA